MSPHKDTDLEVISSGCQIVLASFECLDFPAHVTRIYEGDREPTIKGTPLHPTYTKVSNIPVQDVRGKEDELDLQRNGFQYLKLSPKSYIHPDKDDDIGSYLEEVTERVKAELKADEVICYDYRVSP